MAEEEARRNASPAADDQDMTDAARNALTDAVRDPGGPSAPIVPPNEPHAEHENVQDIIAAAMQGMQRSMGDVLARTVADAMQAAMTPLLSRLIRVPNTPTVPHMQGELEEPGHATPENRPQEEQTPEQQLEAMLGNKPCFVMFDTGSEYSVVDAEWAKANNFASKTLDVPLQAKTINSGHVTINSIVPASLYLRGLQVGAHLKTLTGLTTGTGVHVVLGMDWQYDHHVVTYARERKIQITIKDKQYTVRFGNYATVRPVHLAACVAEAHSKQNTGESMLLSAKQAVRHMKNRCHSCLLLVSDKKSTSPASGQQPPTLAALNAAFESVVASGDCVLPLEGLAGRL